MPPPTDPSQPTPEPPCFNGGKFCNGNGLCVNGQCNCTTGFNGTACQDTIPRITCDDLPSLVNGTLDCFSCLNYATAYGLSCAWCPLNNETTVNTTTQGSCIPDFQCTFQPFYECPTVSDYVPPQCPDNCSGSEFGICLDVMKCAELDANNTRDYGTSGNYKYKCINLNESIELGHNSTCACAPGAYGYNCGAQSGYLGLIAGLAGGIVAAIVLAVLACVCGAMLAGSAGAYATSTSHHGDTKVTTNPIYQQGGKSAIGLSSPR